MTMAISGILPINLQIFERLAPRGYESSFGVQHTATMMAGQ
jgi:hypothetical protein